MGGGCARPPPPHHPRSVRDEVNAILVGALAEPLLRWQFVGRGVVGHLCSPANEVITRLPVIHLTAGNTQPLRLVSESVRRNAPNEARWLAQREGVGVLGTCSHSTARARYNKQTSVHNKRAIDIK